MQKDRQEIKAITLIIILFVLLLLYVIDISESTSKMKKDLLGFRVTSAQFMARILP